MTSNKSVIRGVRLSKETDEIVSKIAKQEDRTISKVISRLVEIGLKSYLNKE